MKTTTILSALVALAALGTVRAETTVESQRSAESAQVQLHEQQDAARYLRCDRMRTDNRATNTIDFTAEGRLCIMDALQKAASVQGTLVLLRNVSVALGKSPQDRALREASLGAVARARSILASQARLLQERPQKERVSDLVGQANALDQAEFSIHLPRLYQSQQIWRLETLYSTGL